MHLSHRKHLHNPVGYQNKDVSRLLSNQIVTFEKVGGEGSDITEFYPVDENGDKLAGEVTAQFYSDKGKLLEEYCWYTGESLDVGYVDGWYDENFDEAKSRSLDFGEGFKISTSYTGSKLVYSGQVTLDVVAVPIPRLLSCKGNIRPCAVEMRDLTIVDENDDPVPGEVTIQFYSDKGKLLEEFCWYTGESLDVGYVDGWYDENFDEPKNKNLEAGAGFCLSTSYTGAFLKFPAIGSKE